MTVPSVGKILNDAQVSLAVHKKCVKQMIQRRHADQDTFLPELCNAILPVLLEFKVRAPWLRPARRAADRRLPAVFRAPRPRVPSTLSSNTRDDTRGDLSPRSAFSFFALLCYVFVRLADAFPPLRPRPPPDSKTHAQRDLCAEREEFAAMASRLREGNLESGEERAASMNAKAHTGWELHCKMGDEAHARALDAWELRREKWEETKRRIALRHDKRPGDLAMERCDEHRRKMEIMSHLDMAAPVHEREGGMSWEWRMSLRNNWTRYVCVGNVFSELYYVRDELAFADPVHVRRRKNVEDGESYSLARGRSVLSSRYLDARRARLRKRVKDVLPGELDDEDVEMLEVVGEGVASLAERRANRRITFEDLEERIAETSVETWAAIQKRRADERAREANERAARLAERERAEIERLASLGPHVRVRDARLNAEAVVSARDGATQEGETRDAARDGGATKVSTVVHNTGTTALWFRWIREEPPGARALGETLKTLTLARTKPKREKPPSRAFYLAEQEGSLLPGESRVVTWTFKCAAPGVYLDSWRLETRPRPRGGDPPPVSLRGVASLEDVKSFARRGLDAELERRRMRAKVETAVETILKGVRTPSPEKRRATRPEPAPTGREVGLWLAGNRERKPRAYYHPEAFARTWKTLREAEKALAMLPQLFEVLHQSINPAADRAAILLQLGFPWAPCADASSLSRQTAAATQQAGQAVAQLSELHLQTSCSTAGTLRKNVQD